jgi:hypothetical protein
MAQLVARLHGMQKVRGSNPLSSTPDLVGVYCAATEQVYLVPIADVPEKGAYLRFEPPKNGQTRGIRWAKDYVIWPVQAGKVLALASSGAGSGDPVPVNRAGMLRSVP